MELVRLSRTTFSLLPESEEFYWQSARVWVLLLLERLAVELPAALVPHLMVLEQHLVDPNFPHAQIRELARRILLNVHEHQSAAFSAATVERIRLCNQPTSCFLDQGPHNGDKEEAFPGVQQLNTFKFDEIDTVDYWFRPLAEVFRQRNEKIAALVERWVATRWNRTDAECERHRLNDQNRYNFSHLYHRKEEDTTVDNLRMHLTHHGLMCAAGELADHYPMYATDYQNATTSWQDWLAVYLPSTAPDAWLADWRGPAPLLPECWGELPMPWRKKTLAHFRAALSMTDPNSTGWLVLYADYKFGSDAQYGNVDVSSIQVAPEGARSLLWALSQVNEQNHNFPTFGLNGYDEGIAEEDPLPLLFQLTPIVEKEKEAYEKGVERHDTSIREIHLTYPRLSQDFITRCNLTAIKGGRQFQDEAGTVVAEYEVWDDDLSDEQSSYNRQAYSSGVRIRVQQGIVLNYLALTGQSLLLQATLSRQTSTHHYSEKKYSYDLGKRRLALLHPNGNLKTVAGCCPLGPAAAEGASPRPN